MDTRADCAVRAVQTALAIPYDDAHAMFKAKGRKDNQATQTKVTTKVLKQRTRRMSYRKGRTVERFIREHPTGRYIVRKRGHLFSIVDGTVSDDTSRKAIITTYWRVLDDK